MSRSETVEPEERQDSSRPTSPAYVPKAAPKRQRKKAADRHDCSETGDIRITRQTKVDRIITLTEPPESWEVPKGETVAYLLDLTGTVYDLADSMGPVAVNRIANSVVSEPLLLILVKSGSDDDLLVLRLLGYRNRRISSKE